MIRRPSVFALLAVAAGAFCPLAGHAIGPVVQPEQAYACTSLARQPDSLNYVERLFAKDGTYVFAWSVNESARAAYASGNGRHGEELSFGRWKEVPSAGGGATLEVSEDIRYKYHDRSWHLPRESARPAFVVEAVSTGAVASKLAADMGLKRRGEAAPTGADGSGFTSTVKGQDYFTCVLRPSLTSGKQELLRDALPKAIEAKNGLEQKVANRRLEAVARDTAQRERYPGMSARQIAEQTIMKLQQLIAAFESRGRLSPQCQSAYNSMTQFYRSAMPSMATAERTGSDAMFRSVSTTAQIGLDVPAPGCP